MSSLGGTLCVFQFAFGFWAILCLLCHLFRLLGSSGPFSGILARCVCCFWFVLGSDLSPLLFFATCQYANLAGGFALRHFAGGSVLFLWVCFVFVLYATYRLRIGLEWRHLILIFDSISLLRCKGPSLRAESAKTPRKKTETKQFGRHLFCDFCPRKKNHVGFDLP